MTLEMTALLEAELRELPGVLSSDPALSINSATVEYVNIYVCKTPYKEVSLSFRFPPEYPAKALYIALDTRSLKPKLLKRMTKLMEEEAERAVGEPHIARVTKFLSSIIASNLLIACGWEIRRVREILSTPPTSGSASSTTPPPLPPGDAKRTGGKGGGKVTLSKGCTMKCGESTGVIRFTLMQPDGAYGIQFKVTVSDGYPATPLAVDFGWSNFPSELTNMVLPQARQVSVCLASGRKPPHVRRREKALGLDSGFIDTGDVVERGTTTDSLQKVRGDLQFLRQATDLREFGAVKLKGNAKAFAHSTRERKEVRRTLRKLTKVETAKEQALEAEAAAEIAEQKAAAFAAAVGETGSPMVSLEETVRFIWESLVVGVPRLLCPGCGELVFHPDPVEAKKLLAVKAAKGKKGKASRRPEQISVFCWWHHCCLDVALTQPPFGQQGCACGNCDVTEPLKHPFWTSDIKKLEKGWAMQQAKKREIAEMSGMLGLESFDVGEEAAQAAADAAW